VLLLAAVLGGTAALYSAQHFAINTDSSQLLSSQLPWRQRELTFDAAFPQRTRLIAIVVDGATPELAERATASLAQRLSQRADLLHHVRRPDGGPFFDRNGLLFLSTEEVARTTEDLIAAQALLGSLAADPSLRGLMDALSLALKGVSRGEAKLEDLTQPLTALGNTLSVVVAGHAAPLAWRALISGKPASPRELRRFILVQPILDYGSLQPGARATQAIRQAARDLRLTPDRGIRVRLTGSVPLADEELATVAEGAAVNTTLTVLAVAALLWLALRAVKLIIAVLISLAVGLAVTAAFGLLVAAPLNLISVAFAVLFVGLGVDFGIQFCVRYRGERYARDDLPMALRGAAGGVGGPLALAAAATAAGFYAFLPTEYRGVSELGLIAGTGMIIAFIASISLLPALLTVLRPAGERSTVDYAAAAPLDRFLTSHRRFVLILSGAIVIACLALLPKLHFDFNPLNLRNPRTESVSTLLDLMKDSATTPNTIDVLAPSLTDAVALADRLAALPPVVHALTLASYVPQDQDRKLALISDASLLLDPTLNPIELKPAPTDAENAQSMARTSQSLRQVAGTDTGSAATAARRLADVLATLAQGGAAQRDQAHEALIPGLNVMLEQLRSALQAAPVTLETLPQDVVRDWVAADGRARIEVFPRGNTNDNDTLRRFVAAVRPIAPDATGAPVSIQEASRTIVRAFLVAGLLAFVSITILLAIVLRRAKDVLLTLAPLLFATALTLGVCVLIDLPLNFANIIALPLLFGIGVAFNIYFVMAWRAGQTHLLQSSLTRAVLFSALTTGTAFGSLWFSSHPGTASMGALLALSLLCTLIAALLFLPALLAIPGGKPDATPAPLSDGHAEKMQQRKKT
jgi:uncharacterized protein